MAASPVTRARKPQRRSAIRILEEAVHLLRRAPGHLFAYYYTGSLPFILGLLYYWGDMSRNAHAADYSAIASLGMALLFVWMKSWQAIFAIRIKALIVDQPAFRLSWRRMLTLVANQTLIHASGFLILPMAAVVMLPFGWCYAFYQNATVLEDRQSQGLLHLCKKSWRQAKMWPNQNHILLGVFFIFGIIVFLNLAVTLFILPYLLKRLLGFESIFTMSGINSLNTTFLATTMALTYLCMDPLVKTAYMLRCYYGEALTSGADIKNQLHRLVRQGKSMAFILFLILMLFPSAALATAPAGVAVDPNKTVPQTISVEDLNRSIEQVLNRREFAWRLPRDRVTEKDAQKQGPIATAVKWIWRMLGKGIKILWRWVEKLFEWLVDLLPKSDPDKNASDKSWQLSIRGLLIVLLFLAAGVSLYLLWRIWQRRRIKPVPVESEVVALVPDINDHGIKADDLTANRWLTMARELWAQGSVRPAMRAFYLATLAHLAEQDLINIEAYKSNLEYEHELQRRAHDQPELLAAFATVVRLVERVWFGMHHISQQELNTFAINQHRIMRFAEE